MPATDPFAVIPAEVDYLNGAIPDPSVFHAISVMESIDGPDRVFMYEMIQGPGIYTLETLNYFVNVNTAIHYTTGLRLVRPAGINMHDVYYCRTCRKYHSREVWEFKAAIAGVPFVPSDLV